MKKVFNFTSIIALLLTACILFAGCGEKKDDGKDVGLMIDGKSFYYLSDEKLASCKAAVIALLENERPSEIYSDFDGNTDPPYPDRPSIAEGYSCGLFDVTGDGVPELFVFLAGSGGSSGNATYAIYDILSGKVLGQVDGADICSLCVYYNPDTDAFMRVDQFWLQAGYDYRTGYTVTLEYDSIQGEYFYKTYLMIKHDEYPDCVKTKFYIEDEQVSQRKYYEKYEYLTRNCIRLIETEMQTFNWSDVSESTDDNTVRAQKMADALFSSGQKFLITEG